MNKYFGIYKINKYFREIRIWIDCRLVENLQTINHQNMNDI